jgi:isocitrate/isopropylmalate dehydrogenase
MTLFYLEAWEIQVCHTSSYAVRISQDADERFFADVPDHISLWGLRLALCQPLQQYANVRPTRILRGITSPLRNCKQGDLDWVIIRENSEGEYSGHGGISHKGHPWAVATETSIFTREGVERIMRFAFEVARKREKRHLTVVTKSNAQRNGMVFWDEVAVEVGKDFPDVKVERMLVDGGFLFLFRNTCVRV